ncbi:putative integrase [Acidianus sp. HS-5]|nr:putative integrase [Acidianus sp. HS-5]
MKDAYVDPLIVVVETYLKLKNEYHSGPAGI